MLEVESALYDHTLNALIWQDGHLICFKQLMAFHAFRLGCHTGLHEGCLVLLLYIVVHTVVSPIV